MDYIKYLNEKSGIENVKLVAINNAHDLLVLLQRNNLNIVTVESLTAGLAASTLVDIPTFGANVYGGFIVYDSDAKRFFLGVKTPNVYSEKTSIQMASGALRHSRATVALAVTGHAGPSSKENLGVVDICVAIKLGKLV